MASNNQPSMVSGHAQYAKGYVEETIGNVTGSKEWQESGKKDTQAGIGEMKVHYYPSLSYPSLFCSSLFFTPISRFPKRMKAKKTNKTEREPKLIQRASSERHRRKSRGISWKGSWM
jgi:uncharacterized protein YjbJ (UPF0337 family)